MSLDMQPAGNTYRDSTNTMTVGEVQNCLTSDPGNNSQHNHSAHFVIQDVEDLVGWQARMNYDGARMRPSTVNFTPFIDNTTGQNVSFLNLPLDAGVHRDVVTATNIPPPAAAFQTALVGAVYNGAQNAGVSPDTPAKSPPDDSSYSTSGGGVLAPINLQVLGGQANMPNLYIDLDDGNPSGPGSDLVIFTGSGTTSISLAETALGDGFHGEGVPCVALGPVPPLPTAPAPPSEESSTSDQATSDQAASESAWEPPIAPSGEAAFWDGNGNTYICWIEYGFPHPLSEPICPDLEAGRAT